jgi:SOS-response transcriptional repressor LexA
VTLVVERRETARDGETVVALWTTRGHAQEVLQGCRPYPPAAGQPAYAPIYADDVRIQGVVVGVLRRYH